jgi:hypothetical protein
LTAAHKARNDGSKWVSVIRRENTTVDSISEENVVLRVEGMSKGNRSGIFALGWLVGSFVVEIPSFSVRLLSEAARL